MIVAVPYTATTTFDDAAKSVHPTGYAIGWSYSDRTVYVEVDDDLLNAEEILYLKLKYKER